MTNVIETSRPQTRVRPVKQPVVGNYFVSAYPPFSAWEMKQTPAFERALLKEGPPTPLGLYIHLPFCQKKCDYCYYLSYANPDRFVIHNYLEAVIREAARYSRQPAIKGRPLRFIYFGGGTPSLLTSSQVRFLADSLREAMSWDGVEEITFECAPRSVRPELLKTLQEIGVTRLSMGAQSFDDPLLKLNGRVHLRADILRAYEQIQCAGFEWVNLDLMAGLPGESPQSWKDTVEEAIELSPDSITIYQTEIPHNTQTCRNLEVGIQLEPLPEWDRKRCRLCYAFNEFEHSGYTVVSGYAAVKNPSRHHFIYQEHLWRGGDMLGLGAASFGYLDGFHYQNKVTLDSYSASMTEGQWPLKRAFKLKQKSQIVREFILQLKWGVVATADFQKKFAVDITKLFHGPLEKLAQEGLLVYDKDEIRLTRAGLYRVDRLLPEFYERPFRDLRYT